MTIKPWISYIIDRYEDVAVVTVKRYWYEGSDLRSERLECFETASKGATRAARKAAAQFDR